MNILHITSLGSLSVLGGVPADQNTGGGIAKNLLECIDYAKQNGLYKSFITCPCETAFSNMAISKGYKTHILKCRWVKLFGRPIITLMDIKKIMKLIDEYKIDVVHAYDFAAGFSGGIAARRKRVPMVISVHQEKTDYRTQSKNIFIKIISAIRRWLVLSCWNFSASSAKKILPVADFIAGTIKHNMHVNHSKLQTVFNGIDLEKLTAAVPRRNALRDEFNIQDTDVLVGSIGRTEKRKGFMYLLEAAKELVKQDVRFKVVVLGSPGDEQADIERAIVSNNLERHFFLAGQRSNIPEIIPGFDIFILPSLMEGMPTVVMEAMYAKIPVIATAVSGTPEIVIDGKTGFLIEPGDPDQIVDSVSQMADLPDTHRERMINCAYDQVIAKFSLQRKISQLYGIYQDVIKRR